jgi:5-methylcytosine-specific restriction enzyme A
LDLYVRHRGNPLGKASAEIVGLSQLLNKIGQQLQGAGDKFRNPNGVYMKIMNFRRFDPAYLSQGKVGLQRGGKDEQQVWERFANRPEELRATADAIKASIVQGAGLPVLAPEEDGMAEAAEGRILTRQHQLRERSRSLVDAKKGQAMRANGKLVCEACGFDFERH